MRALFKHMPRALSGDEEAVHQLRVAGRRLRVALPLLSMHPTGRRVRRARRGLRGLVRTAGTTRDLDVGLQLFDALLTERPTPEGRRLRGRLRAARTRGRATLVRAFLDEDLPALRHDLRVLEKRGDAFLPALKRTRAALVAGGSAARAQLVELGPRFEPDVLHGMRRQLRKLRYVAEVAVALGAAPKEAVQTFKKQQSLLGKIQDAHVLAERLGLMAARCESGSQHDLAREARVLEARLRDLSRAEHRAWLASVPQASLDQALGQVASRAIPRTSRPARTLTFRAG